MELGLLYVLLTQPKAMAGNQGETPGVQAEITITRRSRFHVAPEAFIFEVVVSGFDATGASAGEVYDDRFHELYYFWDFGNPYMFTAPQNLAAGHRNANVAYGPMASHTFRASGNYTVSVLVIEPASGKQTTATMNIAIGNPDALFTGSRTIFVSPSSVWANAPAGAALVTSFNAAVSSVQGDDTTPKRIMLNRGEGYSHSGAGLGSTTGNRWPSCHIVAGPGTGAKPAITCTGGFGWNDTSTTGNGNDKDFILQNIDWIGPFDSSNNSGLAIDFVGLGSNAPNLFLMDGCTVGGFDHSIFVNGFTGTNIGHRVVVINDSTVTNWKQWGFFDGDKVATAITGCSFRAKVDALVDATNNGGGPYRAAGDDLLTIIHSSEFFSRQGWSAHGNYRATQPCLRINTDGYEGSKLNCQASSFEGGFDVIQLNPQGGETARAMNAIFEKNFILGGYQTNSMIAARFGGLTVRNNIMVMPDSQRLPSTNDPYAFLAVSNPDGDPTNRDSPISLYNNTLINLLDSTNETWTGEGDMSETIGGGLFTTFTVANNVIHQPNLTSPAISDAPLDSDTILWLPREKGYQSATVPLQTQTATPPNTVATYAPLTGSAALGDALNEPVAYDDFYGEQRLQYPSRGALEMP